MSPSAMPYVQQSSGSRSTLIVDFISPTSVTPSLGRKYVSIVWKILLQLLSDQLQISFASTVVFSHDCSKSTSVLVVAAATQQLSASEGSEVEAVTGSPTYVSSSLGRK